MGTIVEESQKGNLEGVKRALAAGADINQLDANHDTALTWAAYSGHTEIVRFLLENNADHTIPNSGGATPLQLAEGHGRAEAVQLLKLAAMAPQERWKKMGASTVAHVGTYPDIDQTLTTVFNFKSRERFVIARSITGNAQSQGPASSFDDLPRGLVEEALEAFTRMGGKADRDHVFGGGDAMNKPKIRTPSA